MYREARVPSNPVDVFDPAVVSGEDETTGPPEGPLQQTARIPDDVTQQLRMLATVTGIDEEEHLRRAMRSYLETAGREAEISAFTDRARDRVGAVLDRLGDL
jgi:predicted transcriptional regulator